MPVEHLELKVLEAGDVERFARSITPGNEGDALARFLEQRADGRPLSLVETVYSLSERGFLVVTGRGRRRWLQEQAQESWPQSPSLDEVIFGRILRLPTSARRLLTLAAVIGQRFNILLLAEIEDEHVSVVRANLRIWKERRLVRQVLEPLAEVQRFPEPQGEDAVEDPDQPLEFAHPRIRRVIYESLPKPRRRAIHLQIAEALDHKHDDDSDSRSLRTDEAVAHHFATGERPQDAAEHLLNAARRARDGHAFHRAQDLVSRGLALVVPAGKAQAGSTKARRPAVDRRTTDALRRLRREIEGLLSG